MTLPFQQDNRRSKLSTALGSNVLVLLKMAGTEELSGPFRWTVEALSTDSGIDLNQLLSTHATVSTKTPQGERQFDGIVTAARRLGAGEMGYHYELTLEPWIVVAGLRKNTRIWHNKTVTEIVTDLFKPYAELGKPHFRDATTESVPTLEYTVQFNESDADFATRMLERFGISWFWEHRAGNHTMVLTDSAVSQPDVAGGLRPYYGVARDHFGDEEHFSVWESAERMATAAVRLTDYNFKMPKVDQEVDRATALNFAAGEVESFEWPGDYPTRADGKTMVRLRAEEAEGGNARAQAGGNVASLSAGLGVRIGGEDLKGVTGERFICLKATHALRSQAYASTAAATDERSYEGSYVLMPEGAPFRPERRTPRAVIHGPQTAMVVGDGEVDCDEYGRILVQFHWDLAGAYSMRCRVSQNWAGRGWGGMVIPRIGMEVIVEHLEGDPDKPIVTGCVYNGVNAPPMELPAHKSRSTFKTRSHEGQGFNELTFEDQSGEEFIYLHAQKNLDVHVQNSAKRRVEFDDNVSVGNASNLDVAANRTETIEGKLDVKVTGGIAEKSEADRGADVAGTYAIKTGGDMTIKAAGEIVLDASKITLVSGGAALVVQGGQVNAAPMLNVGSASPGAAGIPTIPEVLKAAAGEGSPFVSHCPMKDDGGA